MGKTRSGPIAVLKHGTMDKGTRTYARSVLNCVKGNAYFANPDPTVALMEAHIDALDAAEIVAQNGGDAELSDRDAKLFLVFQDVKHMKDYVQATVEKTATTPAQAIAMIESAGMRVRTYTKPSKPVFAARRGDASGEVVLTAQAVANSATYYWQWSLDGKNWVSVPDTMKATTTISGLTALQTYYFRFRTMTRTSSTDFSASVSLLVL